MGMTTLPSITGNNANLKSEVGGLRSNAEILKGEFTLDDAVSVVNGGQISGDELENVLKKRNAVGKSKKRWNKVGASGFAIASLLSLAAVKTPPAVAIKCFMGALACGAVTATALGVAAKADNKLQETNDFLLTLAGKKKQKD